MTAILSSRPPGLTRQEELYFDALELLVPACRLSYARMVHAAAACSVEGDETTLTAEQMEALHGAMISDMVHFIGTTERLRKIVNRLPSKPADVRLVKRAFESAARASEDARHYFEHLDDAIPRIAASGHGAFGGITWWVPPTEEGDEQVRMVGYIPGTLAIAKGALVTRKPSSIRYPADVFTTVVGGATYDLTAAHDAIASLEDRLRSIYSD
jgi:hypothetical protein